MVRGASRNASVVSDLVTGRKHSPSSSGNSKIRAAAQCHLGLGNRRLLAHAGREPRYQPRVESRSQRRRVSRRFLVRSTSDRTVFQPCPNRIPVSAASCGDHPDRGDGRLHTGGTNGCTFVDFVEGRSTQGARHTSWWSLFRSVGNTALVGPIRRMLTRMTRSRTLLLSSGHATLAPCCQRDPPLPRSQGERAVDRTAEVRRLTRWESGAAVVTAAGTAESVALQRDGVLPRRSAARR
jgi:hypothetical protein